MQIFVDADACPVVGIVEEIAEKYNIPTTLLCDTNHILYSDYSEVIVVGAGADAVDYKLISICHKGDVVVTQDYGVAAMALGKGAYAIHQSGKWYTNENIDQMLMERHLNKKAQQRQQKFSTREYNRCRICGRPHAYLRKYGICRVCFRELAYKGQIPGVKKASW